MLRSTMVQIYVLLAFMAASLLILPIIFLVIILHQPSEEVQQAVVADTGQDVEFFDANRRPIANLGKSPDWPADGQVISEYNQDQSLAFSRGLVIIQSSQYGDVVVKAVFDGQVIAVNQDSENCGQSVVIETPPNLKIFYCFLAVDSDLINGQSVVAGQPLGVMGFSLGFDYPHFYLITKVADIHVNPRLFLIGEPNYDDDDLSNNNSEPVPHRLPNF